MTVQTDRLSAALAGRYRIERELGAGGMATVYLAFDEKHDRKVAIKVLKPELAAVLGAERFVVEIKTTAAMSHPHILPLFDSGTADGFLFYVMPYIEGETIREKLNRETQFGVDEAVRIAREVADALDYAHRHGVIHRDIKPENILLHDGRAMVMDFGIALAVSAAAGGRMTETGLSLGTPHYMSPEQATAEKEITARSDQYSLASVLYEMLAGDPPFVASAAQAVIMKIITEPALPVTARRKNVPANVDAALAKALEKLPADRFESAKGFGDALSNSAFSSGLRSATEGLARPGSWSRVTRAMATISALLVIALVATLARRPAASTTDLGMIQFSLTSDDSMQVDVGTTRPFALSPDGTAIVFRASRDSVGARLWNRTLADPVARPIEGTEDGMNAAFSPNGEWIAFNTQNVNLKKVRLAGGTVTTIMRTPSRTAAIVWGDDDNLYLEQLGVGGRIGRVSASGGVLEPLIPGDSAGGETSQRRPFLISGDRVIAFASVRGTEEPMIGLFRIADGKRVTLTLPGIGALGYFDGRLVYSRADGTLMAVPVDVKAMNVTGPAVQLEPRVASSNTGSSVALSSMGTLVYGATVSGGLMPLMLVDTTGRVRYLRQRASSGLVQFSPDGKRIAFGMPAAPGSTIAQDLQVVDLTTGVATQFRTSGNAYSVSWSADGKRLYTPKSVAGSVDLMSVSLDGAPETRVATLPAGGQGVGLVDAVRDGQSLIYSATLGGVAGAALLQVWLDGKGRIDTLVLASRDRVEAYLPRISPDGQVVAFLDRSSGHVYARSLAGGGALQVSEVGAHFQRRVVWGADSRHLYYLSASGLTIIEIATSPALRVVSRRVKPNFPLGPGYDLSPDGRTFVTYNPDGRAFEARVAVNWIDEARRAWSKSR